MYVCESIIEKWSAGIPRQLLFMSSVSDRCKTLLIFCQTNLNNLLNIYCSTLSYCAYIWGFFPSFYVYIPHSI